MKTFLKLKHWQLFGILMFIPMIYPFVIMGSVITSSNLTNISSSNLIDITNSYLTRIFATSPVIMVLFTGLLLCWFYSMGTNLHKKLPQTVKMNLTQFKLFLFFPAICKVITSIFLPDLFSEIMSGGQLNSTLLAFAIPLYLFSTFCIFYCFYFIAKALKSVERQEPVTFDDFSEEFVLIWLFPIGVWLIQPKMNKLFGYSLDIKSNPAYN
ncbi:hypothetical protein Barb7_00529 [Bacteroidales bacterium Barb7]|nr:hypothetical protein Barb7_00529 [Bacteroidales bacterium Barb7]